MLDTPRTGRAEGRDGLVSRPFPPGQRLRRVAYDIGVNGEWPKDEIFARCTPGSYTVPGETVGSSIPRTVCSWGSPGPRRVPLMSGAFFSLPTLAAGEILVQANLRLHLVRNDPQDLTKIICVREPPGNPWTVPAELAQPILAERRLARGNGIYLDFDLTGLGNTWLHAGPNRGIVLDFARPVLAVVAFANGRLEKPGPILSLVSISPAAERGLVSLEVGPEASLDSPELPPGGLLIQNAGPGSAWVSLLYRLDRHGPVKSGGTPDLVLDPGGQRLLEPRLSAAGILARIQTALAGARVTLIPVGGLAATARPRGKEWKGDI